MMDSLEKSRDPKFQAQYKAEQTLKKNKEKMEKFLNSSLTVKKQELVMSLIQSL